MVCFECALRNVFKCSIRHTLYTIGETGEEWDNFVAIASTRQGDMSMMIN